MHFKTRIFTGLALLAATLSSAQAHNVWLQPSSTVLSKADWVTVDAAVSNDLFFFNHVPLGLDNLQVTAPDQTAVPVQNAHRGKLRSVFDLDLKQVGTYRVAVVNNGLSASYKDSSGQAKRWRGTAAKFAAEVPANAAELKVTESLGRVETFVTVGKPSNPTPAGKGLELLPVTHFNDLVKGEKSSFILHVDGKPAQGLEVVVVQGGSRYRDQLGEIKASSNAQGEFSITWPQAGMYWLEVEFKDNKTSVPQAAERRLTYAGTFEVLP